MKKFFVAVVAWTLFLIVSSLVFNLCTDFGYINHAEHENVEVIKTERVNTDDSSYYLIFFEDGLTVKVADQLFYGNFRSSDHYGKIREGEKYTVETHGFRVGFFNVYPILYRYRPHTANDTKN